ncbi:hypothetical protein BN1723_002225, partial [Verticillium longisporum]
MTEAPEQTSVMDLDDVETSNSDWKSQLDIAHFELIVPDDTRYGVKPGRSLEDKQADRVEGKILSERERIESQLGPRTQAEQRIIDTAELIVVRRQDIRLAQRRELRLENPSKYYVPSEYPNNNPLKRPVWRGLYDTKLRPVKYYMGHKPGDFIFRYYHLPCLPLRDPRRWVYEGQVPHMLYEYKARMVQKILPDILEALLSAMSFEENKRGTDPPGLVQKLQRRGRIALTKPKIQWRIFEAWKEKVAKGRQLGKYLEVLRDSHLVQEMAWLYKRVDATMPPDAFLVMTLITPNLETVDLLAAKHDQALEVRARHLLFEEGEGWRVVDPAEESRRSCAKIMKHTPYDWEKNDEADECNNEPEPDCSRVLVYTLFCEDELPCGVDLTAAAKSSGVYHPGFGRTEKPLRGDAATGPTVVPCSRHFLRQPRHLTPIRLSRCAIHEHHNKLRLQYGPDHGYYPDERFIDKPSVPDRVDISGLAVQLTLSAAARIEDEATVGRDDLSSNNSSDDTNPLDGN